MPYIIQKRRPGSQIWTDCPNLTRHDRSMSIAFADMQDNEKKVFTGQRFDYRVVRVGRFTGRHIEVVWSNI